MTPDALPTPAHTPASHPAPDHPPLPGPTVWPATLALGSSFIVWGLITSWIISGIGLALFVVALAGWIRELRHEPKP